MHRRGKRCAGGEPGSEGPDGVFVAEHDLGDADGGEVMFTEGMKSQQDFTWFERQFGAFALAGISAYVIGYGLGLWGAGIGGAKLEVGTVLARGVYCALFPVILAWSTRTAWLFMVPIYMIGFGMSFGKVLTFGIRDAIMAFCSLLTGERPIPSQPSSHPDLPWVFAIMLWMTGLAAIVRRSGRFRCGDVLQEKAE